MSELRPFLSFAAPAAAPTAFADALAKVEAPAAPSPWSPKCEPAAPAAPAPDLEAVRRDAIARGREEGLEETAALRGRLRRLVEALEERSRHQGSLAELVAEAACAAIETWATADRRAVFAGVLRSWGEAAGGPATVRVHPDDATAIGETALPIIPDPALAPGEIVVTGDAAELAVRWSERLVELRHAIAAALEAAP